MISTGAGTMPPRQPARPDRAALIAAAGRRVPDLIRRRLKVLFCGINPGLYSAATGHHFARPGNRFWPALHAGGFTPRIVAPWEEVELLELGLGITNLVARATAAAAELTSAELVAGRRRLERKVVRYRPAWVAVLGVGAYRAGFRRPEARLGPQPERLGSAGLWLLPNPSGLNAHHQLGDLAAAFAELRRASIRRPLLPRARGAR
jgi:TDG/mug DNA glycosylase family protein